MGADLYESVLRFYSSTAPGAPAFIAIPNAQKAVFCSYDYCCYWSIPFDIGIFGGTKEMHP
jgi:hypothetical protein